MTCVHEVVTLRYSNLLYKMGNYFLDTQFTIFTINFNENFYELILYVQVVLTYLKSIYLFKMGPDFLDIQ